MKNLQGFYFWLLGENIPDIREGYSDSVHQLSQVYNILTKHPAQRAVISRSAGRRFMKRFEHGMNLILNGIRTAFTSTFASHVNITSEQLARYILDEKEGPGKKFSFNRKGDFAFVDEIHHLDKRQVIATLRLLETKMHHKRIREWDIFGDGNYPVRVVGRIVGIAGIFGTRIYFVYPNHADGKKAYGEMVMMREEQVPFSV